MTAFLHSSVFCASFGSSWWSFISLRTLSIHLSLGLPRGLFPPTFIVVNFLCNILVVSSHYMAIQRKAFLGDICGDWLDHCIAPEHNYMNDLYQTLQVERSVNLLYVCRLSAVWTCSMSVGWAQCEPALCLQVERSVNLLYVCRLSAVWTCSRVWAVRGSDGRKGARHSRTRCRPS